MEEIRIGIWDTEEEYANKLARYLNQKENGQWNVLVLTKKAYVERHLEQQRLHLLLGTEKIALMEFCKTYPSIPMVYLGDEKNKTGSEQLFLPKYQGAESVYQGLKQIVWEQKQKIECERKLYGMYSPVGRCGKTTMLLDVLSNHTYGKWLYIGMEEYSFLWEPSQEATYNREDFLYFVKERNEEKVKKMMSIYQDILAISGSPFDKKELEKEDFIWLKEMLQTTNYQGAVVDLGTGILKDFESFRAFQKILVPYIENEKALKKKSQFEELLKWCGFQDVVERMVFINMDKREYQEQVLQHFFE